MTKFDPTWLFCVETSRKNVWSQTSELYNTVWYYMSELTCIAPNLENFVDEKAPGFSMLKVDLDRTVADISKVSPYSFSIQIQFWPNRGPLISVKATQYFHTEIEVFSSSSFSESKSKRPRELGCLGSLLKGLQFLLVIICSSFSILQQDRCRSSFLHLESIYIFGFRYVG